MFRIANGVTFGDGTTWSTEQSDDKQWLAVVDGMTGALSSYIDIPEDFISDGPLALQLGIGYHNGTTPSIVAYMKNRQPKRGDFNVMIAAFNYRSNELEMDWKWTSGGEKGAEGHQFRIIDLDGDGKDEIAQIGYDLNGDGTLRYTLNKYNVIHGDRFYIGKLDPDAEGLQGYGIQQDKRRQQVMLDAVTSVISTRVTLVSKLGLSPASITDQRTRRSLHLITLHGLRCEFGGTATC